ncbi:hypothetical protein D3C76_963090 [compost metagenome]
MLDAGGTPGAALTEHGQSCSAVFTALVVMGCGGQKVIREVGQPLCAGGMERLGRGTEAPGVEPHIVARQQHCRAVESGVFHGLGGGGRGQLLEANAGIAQALALAPWRQAAPTGAAEPLLKVFEYRPVGFAQCCACSSHGLGKINLVFGGAAAGIDVGAIHRVMHDQFLQGTADSPQCQVAGHQVIAGYL